VSMPKNIAEVLLVIVIAGNFSSIEDSLKLISV
jgi:hypothetical protein